MIQNSVGFNSLVFLILSGGFIVGVSVIVLQVRFRAQLRLQKDFCKVLDLELIKLKKGCLMTTSPIIACCDDWNLEACRITQELDHYPDVEFIRDHIDLGPSIDLRISRDEEWVVRTNERWEVSIRVDRRSREKEKRDHRIQKKLKRLLRKKAERLSEASANNWLVDFELWETNYQQRLPKEILENTDAFFQDFLLERNLLTVFEAPLCGDPVSDTSFIELRTQYQLYSVWLRHLEGAVESCEQWIKPLAELDAQIQALESTLGS